VVSGLWPGQAECRSSLLGIHRDPIAVCRLRIRRPQPVAPSYQTRFRRIAVRRPVAVQGLNLVARIKPGQEELLRGILREMGASPQTNRYIRLHESASTHLANWVILNDPENGYRLFFTSNYDGDLPSYVHELLRVGPGIDEIFGQCVGYAGRD